MLKYFITTNDPDQFNVLYWRTTLKDTIISSLSRAVVAGPLIGVFDNVIWFLPTNKRMLHPSPKDTKDFDKKKMKEAN